MMITIVPAKSEYIESAERIAVAAWTKIHESYKECIGEKMHDDIFKDWENDKINSVRAGLLSGMGYVALAENEVAGFISYRVEKDKAVGEILANAVDEKFRGLGIGGKMYEFVLSEMKREGVKYAVVNTGLDEGHAPARRAYEKIGFKKNLPSVKYYMELE